MAVLANTENAPDHLLHLNKLLQDMSASFLNMEKTFSRFDFNPIKPEKNGIKNGTKNGITYNEDDKNRENLIKTLDLLMDDLAISYTTLPNRSQTLQPRVKKKFAPEKPPRKFSFNSADTSYNRRRCKSDSKVIRKALFNDIHTIKEHSTLCRKLKSLEVSYGVTLEKHLHNIIQNKMKLLNISGCVYCMYSLYEKQKRDAEDKARQIRNTIHQQEHLQKRLNEEKARSDADNMWLESEDTKGFAEPAIYSTVNKVDKRNKRSSWQEGLHTSGSKSDSEQLGYDLYKDEYARDILDQKLAKRSSPLRRSIPLWGLERTDFTKEKPIVSPLVVEKDTSKPPANETISTTNETSQSEESVVSSTSTETPSTPPANGVDNTLAESEAIDRSEIDPPRSFSASEAASSPVSKEQPFLRTQSEITPPSATVSDSNLNDAVASSTPRVERSSDVSSTTSLPGEDKVYQNTTRVVKSVIELSTGVQHADPEEFVDLVKVVGLNLRDLLSEVDKNIQQIPLDNHKEIEMAHKVLSSDMAELVAKMKLAQKYAHTTLDQKNRRNMLAAAQALAIDAKNLYDTYAKLIASNVS